MLDSAVMQWCDTKGTCNSRKIDKFGFVKVKASVFPSTVLGSKKTTYRMGKILINCTSEKAYKLYIIFKV